MSASALALTVTIGILPAFGITMVILDHLSRRWASFEPWVVERAALVYLLFVVGGVGVAAWFGLLPAAALWGGPSWLTLVAVIGAPVAAVVPYLLELALVSAGRGDTGPTLGAALFMREAEPAVAALLERPRVWWFVAIGTAVTEELLFRGALQHAVLLDVGPLPAVLASAFVFGLHHVAFGFNAILGKVCAGLLWGGLALLAGTVVVSLIAHLVFQLLVWRRFQKTRASHDL